MSNTPRTHVFLPTGQAISVPDVQSLIEIALYGGGDWIEKIRYPDDIKSRDAAVENMWNNMSYIEFKPWDEDPQPLTIDGILDAIQADPQRYDSVMSGEGDQTDADMLLQSAIFGEVVFG